LLSSLAFRSHIIPHRRAG